MSARPRSFAASPATAAATATVAIVHTHYFNSPAGGPRYFAASPNPRWQPHLDLSRPRLLLLLLVLLLLLLLAARPRSFSASPATAADVAATAAATAHVAAHVAATVLLLILT